MKRPFFTPSEYRSWFWFLVCWQIGTGLVGLAKGCADEHRAASVGTLREIRP
jgi:hypothetical protein